MSGTKFVLVVEDDDEIRNIIVSSLKAECQEPGLIVIEAKDGREAIQFAGRQEFQCVVTDLNMPKSTGQELIKVLLSDAMNANTPTVVVSAGIDDEFLSEFRGVRSMPKPFDPVQLSQTVLREMKLGRMDERVPIHLLNPFTEALRSVLVDDMQISPDNLSLLPPAIRKSGEPIQGSLFASIILTTGMMQARIAFAFEHEFLVQMKNVYFGPRRAQLAAMNMEMIARHTAQVLIEKANPALAAIFGAVPRIAEIVVSDLVDPAKSQELSKAAGVSIALATDQGRVFVSAMAPLKAKRGVA